VARRGRSSRLFFPFMRSRNSASLARPKQVLSSGQRVSRPIAIERCGCAVKGIPIDQRPAVLEAPCVYVVAAGFQSRVTSASSRRGFRRGGAVVSDAFVLEVVQPVL